MYIYQCKWWFSVDICLISINASLLACPLFLSLQEGGEDLLDHTTHPLSPRLSEINELTYVSIYLSISLESCSIFHADPPLFIIIIYTRWTSAIPFLPSVFGVLFKSSEDRPFPSSSLLLLLVLLLLVPRNDRGISQHGVRGNQRG